MGMQQIWGLLGSAFLIIVQGHLYVHCNKIFLLLNCHQEQRRKLINKINKKELLTVPPGNGAKILIELEPTHRKYRISKLYNSSVQVLNATAIASGYAGRDPQGGTSDGSFF